MATAIYKIDRRFDYCDADRLRSYLWSKGIDAQVESGYPKPEIRITSNAPVDVINKAVEMAVMHYCPTCVRRLHTLSDHMI